MSNTIGFIKFETAELPSVIASLEVVTELEVGARLMISGTDFPAIYPNMVATICSHQESSIEGYTEIKFYIESLSNSSTVCGVIEAPYKAGFTENPLMLYQKIKEESESLVSFLNRCYPSQSYTEPSGYDGPMDTFDEALPVGSCISVQSGEVGKQSVNKLLRHIQQTTPSIMGYSRSLHDKEWSLITYNPNVADTNWFIDLDLNNKQGVSSWCLYPDQGESGCSIQTTLAVETIFELLNVLQDPVHPKLEGNKNKIDLSKFSTISEQFYLPLLPTTIKLNQRFYFCSKICYKFKIQQTTQYDEIPSNLEIVLQLIESPSYSVVNTVINTHVLLGVYKGWNNSKADTKIVTIAPVESTNALEPELAALTHWKIGGNDAPKSLTACWITPGYSREEASAFYAQLKQDDLILFQLSYGSLPIVLGGVQQRREAFEAEDKPDVALSASKLAVISEQMDLTYSESFTVGKEGSLITATEEEIEILSTGLKVKKDEVIIANKVEIK